MLHIQQIGNHKHKIKGGGGFSRPLILIKEVRMTEKENLASVLAGAYKLGYRWLVIDSNLLQIRVYKEEPATNEVPLELNFDPQFARYIVETCKSKQNPIIISEILVEFCASEAHALYYDEKGYSEKATIIRHKPNRLTAIREEGTRYLLTLNGVVRTNPGDWVIRGVNGEEYPCAPEIFKKLYDIVEE